MAAVVVAFTTPRLPPRSSTTASTLPSLNAKRCNHHRNIVILSHNVSQDVALGFFDVNALLTDRIDVLARCVNSALWISNGVRNDTSVFLMLFPHNLTVEVRGEEVTCLNPDERTMALFLQRALLAENEGSANASRAKLERLRERDLRPPATFNPHKPGSLSKSQRRSFRIARKQREATIRRIYRLLNDTGVETGGMPSGFVLHRHDSLQDRLKTLDSGDTFMMDEHGEPLAHVLGSRNDHPDRINVTSTTKTTTIILGDQIGYSPCDETLLAEDDAVTKVSLGPLSLLTSQCITIAHNCLDIQYS